MSEFYAAAKAIVENSEGEILMVQEGKDHIDGRWDFPGGGWEDNESVIECVNREVLEETGYLTEAENLVGIWKGESKRDGTEVIVFVFKSNIVERKFDQPDKSGEILDQGFFRPEEIRQMDMRRAEKIKILEKYEEGEFYPLEIILEDLNLLESE